MTQQKQIVIIGGGAAGFFAAIHCARNTRSSNTQVSIFEGTQRPLTKVKISGGGRCNVTHNCFDVDRLLTHYPRGAKELRGPMHTFQPKDTVAWFQKQGVELKAEADGRMFPKTNDSQTIIDCLQGACEQSGVGIKLGRLIKEIVPKDGKFELSFMRQENLIVDKVLIATGSGPLGHKFAKALGHSIVPPVPSLFTFMLNSLGKDVLSHLAGSSVANTKLSLAIPGEKKTWSYCGPLLWTHWGVSGPAVLKLSAWAARALHSSEYKGSLTIDWTGDLSTEALVKFFETTKDLNRDKQLKSISPEFMTKKLWEYFLTKNDFSLENPWKSLQPKTIERLSSCLKADKYSVGGKGEFKEEFVTCGGVKLSEVNFKTMESKICPGLFFAGEILDIDGITGGFNFQNAWTTGYIAGISMA